MRNPVLPGLLLGAALAAPAQAQRTDENAVRSAEDAFGTSVGNERVGLYNPFNARGFSPVAAGNVRIEGLYFDLQADITDRLVGGSTVRVGLTAQSYPFPAPTGIADFSLRKAGGEAVLSTVVGYGPFGGARVELDGQLPLSSTLSVAAGFGANREELLQGERRLLVTGAVIPRWRPSENVEIIPFWSMFDFSDQETQPIVFTGGSFLPPKIERRRYFGADWAENSGRGTNYGLVSNVALGGLTLRAGAFRSLFENDEQFTDLTLNTDREGFGNRLIIAERDRRFGSISGELRASRRFAEGDRLHTIHVAARGRQQKRRYGGGDVVDFGRRPIDEPLDVPKPDFEFGPQTRDEVRQLTGGIGYEGRWRDVGELSLGLQKTSYRKEVETPAGPLPTSKASPWLLNGTLSIYASPRLAFYAGYTRGLEESPVAPEVAINKDEAPPAIETRQMDAGLRYLITDNLRLVAGVFEVEKPYFGLDNQQLFTSLGTVRNRGVELSLAGTLLPGLNAVVGTVFLDADLSGSAVEQGLVGSKPVASIPRYTTAALDYTVPWVPGLSVDLFYESTSDRVADRLNTFEIPARYIVSLGGRYRFDLAGNPATLRAQVATLNNRYGFGNIGEGFYYNFPRRFSVSLTTDI